MSPITTEASGEVDGPADKAQVNFSVEETGDEANDARRALTDRVPPIRDGLADLPIEGDQIRTTNYGIREGPHRGDDTESPQFIARQEFTVAVEDLDLIGQIIDSITEHGANRIRGIVLLFSEEKRRELRRAALERAMENVREQADVLAREASLSVTGVESIETSAVDFSRRRTGIRAMSAGSGVAAGTEIDSGPLTVTATVKVTFAAER